MEKELKLLELFGMISKKLWKLLAPTIKDLKLTSTDLLVLIKLAKLKSCKVSELAQATSIPSSTLTGITDRLVSTGFINREHDQDDRRSIILKATPRLKEIIHERKYSIGNILSQTLMDMPEESKDRLIEDLQFICDSLG